MGMNAKELKANPQLSGFTVHDLNENPFLPFDTDGFDTAICTVSIEYLARPLEVMSEVSRVVKPGGIFVCVVSDRWFPSKEISIWSEMHPFERLGLVLDYYFRTGFFEDLHTESVRGLPRPPTDKYVGLTRVSDPIFAVWGTVKG